MEPTIKVNGLLSCQGLGRRVDINPAVQILARGQSINLASANSLGFYCFYCIEQLQHRNEQFINK